MRALPLLLLALIACTPKPKTFQQDRRLLPEHEYTTVVSMQNTLTLESRADSTGQFAEDFSDERSLFSQQVIRTEAGDRAFKLSVSMPEYRTASGKGEVNADLGGWLLRATCLPEADSLQLDSLYYLNDYLPDSNRVQLNPDEVSAHMQNTLALLQSSLKDVPPAMQVGDSVRNERLQQMTLGPYQIRWKEVRTVELESLDDEQARYAIRLQMIPEEVEGLEIQMQADGGGYSLFDRKLNHTIEHKQSSHLSIELAGQEGVWRAQSKSRLLINTGIEVAAAGN